MSQPSCRLVSNIFLPRFLARAEGASRDAARPTAIAQNRRRRFIDGRLLGELRPGLRRRNVSGRAFQSSDSRTLQPDVKHRSFSVAPLEVTKDRVDDDFPAA